MGRLQVRTVFDERSDKDGRVGEEETARRGRRLLISEAADEESPWGNEMGRDEMRACAR